MTAVLTFAEATAACDIGPTDVRDVLARSILADGLDFVLDIDRSSGSYLVDARTGERFLDMLWKRIQGQRIDVNQTQPGSRCANCVGCAYEAYRGQYYFG